MPKNSIKKMTREEINDWNELYQFVKVNVMNYDDKQALSKNITLRLKGLLNDKFMANNNIQNNADYSFKVILKKLLKLKNLKAKCKNSIIFLLL